MRPEPLSACFCAVGESRTPTILRSLEPESSASTSSATTACRRAETYPIVWVVSSAIRGGLAGRALAGEGARGVGDVVVARRGEAGQRLVLGLPLGQLDLGVRVYEARASGGAANLEKGERSDSEVTAIRITLENIYVTSSA